MNKQKEYENTTSSNNKKNVYERYTSKTANVHLTKRKQSHQDLIDQ